MSEEKKEKKPACNASSIADAGGEEKVAEVAEKAEDVAVAAAEEAEEAKEEAVEAKEVAVEAKEEVAEVKEEIAEEPQPKADQPVAEKVEEKPAPSGKFKDLIKSIENLSVLELSELVKELENRFGVFAAAPVAPLGGAAAGAAEVEEKSSYDVVLASAGDKKIQVIKAVREIKSDLGLVEAKNLVESAPKEVLKGAKKEDAEAAKAKLEAAGATVELK